MKRFARDNQVVFVNSISMGLPGFGSPELLTKIRRKLRSYVKYVRRTPEGIWVVTPILSPFFSNPIWRRINHWLLVTQLRLLLRWLRIERPILWIAIPTARDMVGQFNESLVAYHVSDKYDANPVDTGGHVAFIRQLHEELITAADLVFYHGWKLLADAQQGREKSFLLEQAVDFEHFAAARHGSWECPPPLAPIKRLGKPILGFFGAIERWQIDQSLIMHVSEHRPDWQFVFIGNKTAPLQIERLPNVHFIPAQPYAELPAFAANFDVCVVPKDATHDIVKYTSATKVREYLATGKPVVIVPIPEFEPMADVVRIARTPDDFIHQVEACLVADTETDADRRQMAVRNKTWDARFIEVAALLEQQLKQRQPAR
ncbi:glycosyltransferase [Chloracidobacterium validum]|uniref:Glycosyltransferase n=1 Tax=Chloracidobacterium validum TaxID=2821543 RepID=A0ABX8BBN0_9BACT|nr:glycosyltransferase [Chloracidobacterium validum]QUW03812.1 glycosyltransferase [Chloracidobacterium validum]